MSTQFIHSLVDTWNAAGTTFKGIGLNVTDTASAAGSLLIDLQVGGVSQFRVTKAGAITAGTLALGSLTGLGTGVATFLATPTSADLAAAVTDETGTGALVFANTPTLTTPNIGAATGTSVNLSSRSFIHTLTIGLGGATAVADNTALGFEALNSASLTGQANTAVGYRALLSNTTGGTNSAMGVNALVFNTTGGNNSAFGVSALRDNTTGGGNSAVGLSALFSNTTGSNNVAVGGAAASTLTTGSRNTLIGDGTVVSAVGVDDETVVGQGLTGKGADTAFIGGTNGAFNEKNVTTWETTSDQRIKKNVSDFNDGLAVIEALRVRTFEYRTPEEITEVPQSAAIDKQGVQIGVIAQEIQQVLPACVTENSTGVLSVNTDPLVWHLINAVKELSAEIKALKGKTNV